MTSFNDQKINKSYSARCLGFRNFPTWHSELLIPNIIFNFSNIMRLLPSHHFLCSLSHIDKRVLFLAYMKMYKYEIFIRNCDIIIQILVLRNKIDRW